MLEGILGFPWKEKLNDPPLKRGNKRGWETEEGLLGNTSKTLSPVYSSVSRRAQAADPPSREGFVGLPLGEAGSCSEADGRLMKVRNLDGSGFIDERC